jgi:hypothetical protein
MYDLWVFIVRSVNTVPVRIEHIYTSFSLLFVLDIYCHHHLITTTSQIILSHFSMLTVFKERLVCIIYSINDRCSSYVKLKYIRLKLILISNEYKYVQMINY